MEMMLTSLLQGAEVLARPEVIALLLLGVLWGSFCGAMPGVGSGVGIGVMVPLTYQLDPVAAVAFLVSISVANAFGNGLSTRRSRAMPTPRRERAALPWARTGSPASSDSS